MEENGINGKARSNKEHTHSASSKLLNSLKLISKIGATTRIKETYKEYQSTRANERTNNKSYKEKTSAKSEKFNKEELVDEERHEKMLKEELAEFRTEIEEKYRQSKANNLYKFPRTGITITSTPILQQINCILFIHPFSFFYTCINL
jgi:hypothetical protein